MECSLGIEAGAGTRAIGVLILILMECSLGTAKAAIEAGAGTVLILILMECSLG